LRSARRRSLTVLAAAAALCVAACGGSKPPGPLQEALRTSVLGAGQECIPQHHAGAVITDGFTSVRLTPGPPVTVDRLWFQQPRGIRQTAAFVVPDGGDPYGDVTGNPPSQLPPHETAFDWAARQNAVGARIAHAAFAKPNMDLLVIARMADVNDASEQGIDVWYHVGSQHYHLRTNVTMLDRTHC
jgi:hypothetical protein